MPVGHRQGIVTAITVRVFFAGIALVVVGVLVATIVA
jgi:hypothetical protein